MNLHEVLVRCARSIFAPQTADPDRDPSPELLADCRKRIVLDHAALLEPRFGAILARELDAARRHELYDRFAATAPGRSLDPAEAGDRFLAWLFVEAGWPLDGEARAELRAALEG